MYYLFYIYWISKDITLGYPYIIEPLVSTVLIGLVLFSITTLGCCGVIEEVICCISMYSIVLLLIANLQLLLTNFILFVIDDYSAIEGSISEDFKNSFRWFPSDPSDKVLVDNLQQMIGCCGSNAPTDWKSFTVPSSCCSVSDMACNINSPYLYTAGCIPKMTNFIMYHHRVIAYTSGFLGSFEVSISFLAVVIRPIYPRFCDDYGDIFILQ
nr:unnamed protein product [Callosobruchus analis]